MRNTLCWICGLAIVTAGCGGGPSGGGTPDPAAREQAALKEVGELYRIYVFSTKKPPGKLPDLAPLKTAAPNGFGALKAGDIVVRYGAMMTDTNEGPANTPSDEILAYEKKAPESGGQVLMLDRTIKAMTADEFKAARKAGKG